METSAKDRAITYSLLAHIRSQGQLAEGPLSVFTPLIKRTLSSLNQKEIYSGKSITEIKIEADTLYKIDFPIPVLRTILTKIAHEINSDQDVRFQLFQDDSFQIKNYTFTEFEETIRIQKLEIENIERLFQEFCSGTEHKIEDVSIFKFIESHKLTLSKYLAHRSQLISDSYPVEAQFVDYFKKIPQVYDFIRKIYLGSILVTYIEYNVQEVSVPVELLLDTNFILGLLDLNTPESTHTCTKIIEIAHVQKYRLTILADTIEEIQHLLKAKALHFNSTYLQKKIYPEDIYNACDRRQLNSADLEHIADNLPKTLNEYRINLIAETTKFKNIARFSPEYEKLKKIRNNSISALHDATAIHYVRLKRVKRIRDFEKVNCWFLNNAVTREKYALTNGEGKDMQPETIKADDFLNILWLSSPSVKRTTNLEEIAEVGLSSMVALSISDTLPKLQVIRELDDNINKYSKDGAISDQDIIRIATRITNRQLTELDGLNKLANADKDAFVKRLNAEAAKQKEDEEKRFNRLDQVLKNFGEKSLQLDRIKGEFHERAKSLDERLNTVTIGSESKDRVITDLEGKQAAATKEIARLKQLQIKNYFDSEISRWRKNAWIELALWILFAIIGILWILWISEWSLANAIINWNKLQANVLVSYFLLLVSGIFSSITMKKLYDRYHNHSNIENYKKGIEIPDNLK
jgi:hypothetical protein